MPAKPNVENAPCRPAPSSRPFRSKAARRRGPATADLQEQLDRRTRELKEALEQQTATANVLQVISRSTFDLHTVLDTLLKSAVRLCDADAGTITQRRDNVLYRSVSCGLREAFAEYIKDIPVKPGRDTCTGRALLERRTIHIPDVQADPDYAFKEAQRLGAYRTMLGVPMLREGIPVGVLTLSRSEVRPFSDKQIKLVTTFADQAAIAIENTRLFEAEQQRTRDLTKSLEQQTATWRCFRSSAARPAILSRCLPPCSRRLSASAALILEIPIAGMVIPYIWWRRTTPHLLSTKRAGACLCVQIRKVLRVAWWRPGR